MFTGTATAATCPAESITMEKIMAAARLIDQHQREDAFPLGGVIFKISKVLP